MRVRQSQLHSDPDWRYRRACSDPQIGSGAHGLESGSGRYHGELHVGMYCGHFAAMIPAVEHIRDKSDRKPRVAVVLGSGLGAFADELAESIAFPYSDIPGWPQSTAAGHA